MTRNEREIRNKRIYKMSFKKSIEDLCRLFNLTPTTIKKIIKREREKRNIIIPDIYLEAFREGKENKIILTNDKYIKMEIEPIEINDKTIEQKGRAIAEFYGMIKSEEERKKKE